LYNFGAMHKAHLYRISGILMLLAVTAILHAQAAPQAQPTPQAQPQVATPAQPSTLLAHFHHVHLNTTDPAAAVNFYGTKFESEKRKFLGVADAVWSHNVWLLFTKVGAAPKPEVTSALWHMGWGGGPDMKETYRKQVESGTTFQTPLTDISDQCDGKGGNGRFLFSYVDAPEHALVELNTTAAGVTYFDHVHLLSNDPIAAAEWYVKEFGLRRRGTDAPSHEVRYRCGRQTAPSVGLLIDDVSFVIYPVGNAQAAFPEAWKGRDSLESSQGHAIDHIGFSVDNLDQTLERLKKDGVKVTEEPRSLFNGQLKYAFIEGPDHLRIEVVEDHSANR
jgi:catechol 2,3-dioxygenase-like lactoylglutathione lyase family enzyme